MSLKSAYGAGVRAGRSYPPIVVIDGINYVGKPECPFKRHQFLRAFLWNEGYYNGLMQRLTQRRIA